MFKINSYPFLARTSLIIILVIGLLGITPVQSVPAATLVVTNTNDGGAGSLRQTIADAASGEIITFHSSLSGQSITLTSTLVIGKNLKIDGSGLPSKISISGNNSVAVIHVTSNAVVTLKKLIIKNGLGVNPGGGGIYNLGTLNLEYCSLLDNNAYAGGGIYNGGVNISATLTVTNSEFINNSASDNGGGIRNYDGTLAVSNSIFSNNRAQRGGGINAVGGTITINNSNFSNNAADGGFGGGLDNGFSAMVTVSNSVFANNTAYSGGGIYHNSSAGTQTISGSTFINNTTADRGGAIFNGWGLELTNNTFQGNVSDTIGGGVFNNLIATLTMNSNTFSGNSAHFYGGAIYNLGYLNLINNILANSTSGGDCYENSDSSGSIDINLNNLIETNATPPNHCGTPSITTDPLLDPLKNNGGFTQTMALLPGSPAINTGDDDNCPDTDQRGVARPQGSHCDIGAYELEPIFGDVPFNYWSWSYIEGLYNAGVTAGCGSGNYCPTTTVTRDQMAVFLLRGKHGSSYSPPLPSGVFGDVPVNHWAAAWIEQLAAEGITAGCGSGNYCPATPVTRDQMAVFLLRAKHGSSYSPPTASGVFGDVPTGHWAAPWIEQLAAEGITAGCGNGNYCPATPVTRDQMAVFLVRTFNLPLP